MFSIWNPATPRKSGHFMDVFSEIRAVKTLFAERLDLDHYSASAEDPDDPTCDGYHKFLTLSPGVVNLLLDQHPYPFDWDSGKAKVPTDSGMLFLETISGKIRLRYSIEKAGVIIRSTLR